jgi:hypothetical protein
MTRKDQFAQLQKRSLEESENIINSIGGSYGYIYANMMKGSDGKVNGSMGRYLSDTPTDEEKAAVQAFVQEKILNKLPNSLRPEQNLEDQDDAKDWKQFGLGSNPSGSKPIFERVKAIANIPMEEVGVTKFEEVEGGLNNSLTNKFDQQVFDVWSNKFGKMSRPQDPDAAKKLLQITSLNKEFDGNKIVQEKVNIIERNGVKTLVVPVITSEKDKKGEIKYVNLEDQFALKDLFRNFSGIGDDEASKSKYENIYDFFNQ